MSRGSCQMSSLVHAGRDGRLGERDVASLHRHLRSCTACAQLDRDLATAARLGRRLGDELPTRTALEHRRERLRLLRAAASPRKRPSRLRSPMTWLVAALATGALGWGVMMATQTPARTAVVLSLVPRLDASLPTVQAVVTPAPAAQYEIERSPTLEQVALHAGTIRAQVPSLVGTGRRFIVKTADAEVRVKGTDFEVSAENEHLVGVMVHRGVVEIRRGTETTLLEAGQQWPPRVATSPSSKPATRPHRPGVRTGRQSGSVLGATKTAPGQRSSIAASATFKQAVQQLERGQYQRCIQQLRAFVRLYSNDARVEDARYLIIIAYQRAGRDAAVKDAARDYLAHHPQGYRQSEAQELSR